MSIKPQQPYFWVPLARSISLWDESLTQNGGIPWAAWSSHDPASAAKGRDSVPWDQGFWACPLKTSQVLWVGQEWGRMCRWLLERWWPGSPWPLWVTSPSLRSFEDAGWFCLWSHSSGADSESRSNTLRRNGREMRRREGGGTARVQGFMRSSPESQVQPHGGDLTFQALPALLGWRQRWKPEGGPPARRRDWLFRVKALQSYSAWHWGRDWGRQEQSPEGICHTTHESLGLHQEVGGHCLVATKQTRTTWAWGRGPSRRVSAERSALHTFPPLATAPPGGIWQGNRKAVCAGTVWSRPHSHLSVWLLLGYQLSLKTSSVAPLFLGCAPLTLFSKE